MLNYITIKKDARYEYRLHIDTQNEINGIIIYKGHVLGVNESLLMNLLDYKLERSSDIVYFMDYSSEDRWFVGTKKNPHPVVNQSYESLQAKAKDIFGKFRKIIITANQY
jgi:hypothetical protein